MDHAALRELAAGAALDDLDPIERGALDAHLAACGPCRRLAADLGDVVGELALVAPVLQPPADLREHVLAALRDPPGLTLLAPDPRPSTDGRPVALDSRRPRPALADRPGASRRGAMRLRWGGLATAAVLAVVAVGLGVGRQQLADELAATRDELADARLALTAQGTAVTVVADPAHRTVPLHAEAVAPDARAQVMYRPGTTEAVLMATDLPATPAGRVYQLWYADAAGVHPLGTYHFDGQGPFVAPFGVDLASSAAAMVTLEPEGGATGEPGPQVVFGEL